MGINFEVKNQMLNPKIRIVSSNKITEYMAAEKALGSSKGVGKPFVDYIEIGGRVEPSAKYYLMSYQFTESVNNFSGSFSVSIYEDVDTDSKECIFSKVKNLDIVFIYEDSEKNNNGLEKNNPVFIGVVHRKNTRSIISNGKVNRSTSLEGNGIYSLIGDLSVSLDIHTLTGINASQKQTEFTAAISGDYTYPQIIEKLYKTFSEINEEVCNNVVFINLLLKSFFSVDKTKDTSWINKFFDYGKMNDIKYPVMASFWTQSVNNFSDMLRTLLPSNVFEIFGSVDENGKPRLKIREMPFSPKEWSELEITPIKPVYLSGYDISQSDSEVYNAFLAYIEGSPEDPAKYATLAAIENKIDKDVQKMARYGYRPLQVSFRGYDISTEMEKDKDSANAIKKCNGKLKEWYGALDELYTGQISLVRGEGDKLPKVGERVKFINYEFYVTDKSHSWNFMGPINVTLSVSRGAYYDKNGNRVTSGEEKTRERFGCRYAELKENMG